MDKKLDFGKTVGITSNVICSRIGALGYYFIRAACFQCIDFNLQKGFFDIERLSYREDIEKVIFDHTQAINESGLIVSQTHAPYYYMDCHIKNLHDFYRYLESVYTCIEITSEIRCKYMVLHPFFVTSGLSHYISQYELNLIYIKKLAQYAENKNVFIAIENLPYDFCNDSFSHKELIDNLCCKNICACFDTGHAFITEKNNMINHARIMKDLIKVVHIHDNDGINDQHLNVCAGKIKWSEILNILLDNNGIETLSLELSGVYKNCNLHNISQKLIRDFKLFSNVLGEVRL